MQNLRPYQVSAVDAIEAEYARGVRSTLVEHATGVGKTTTATEVARRCIAAGGRVLAIAHRRELIKQFADRLRSFGLIVGIECGADRAGTEPAVVASVQTFRGARLARWSPDAFDMIVVDEAHHTPSESYGQILRHFARARVLGITATGDRADGVGLGGTFETVAHRYGIREAIGAGHLVPVIGRRVVVEGLDLSAARTRTRRTSAGAKFTDLHPGDLGLAAIAPAAVEGVAGPLLQLAGSRRTVVFAVDRRHARAIAAALCARRPGSADVVDGEMTDADRADVLARHRAGKFQFLVNVLVLTEGYDDPEIACVAMARPTQSRALYAQCVGRGLRLASGKYDCLVLDFAPAACPHVLVGPDDVLEGALVAPVVAGAGWRRPPAAAIAPYASPGRAARFFARAMDLLRAGGRAITASGRGLWRALVTAIVG